MTLTKKDSRLINKTLNEFTNITDISSMITDYLLYSKDACMAEIIENEQNSFSYVRTEVKRVSYPGEAANVRDPSIFTTSAKLNFCARTVAMYISVHNRASGVYSGMVSKSYKNVSHDMMEGFLELGISELNKSRSHRDIKENTKVITIFDTLFNNSRVKLN